MRITSHATQAQSRVRTCIQIHNQLFSDVRLGTAPGGRLGLTPAQRSFISVGPTIRLPARRSPRSRMYFTSRAAIISDVQSLRRSSRKFACAAVDSDVRRHSGHLGRLPRCRDGGRSHLGHTPVGVRRVVCRVCAAVAWTYVFAAVASDVYACAASEDEEPFWGGGQPCCVAGVYLRETPRCFSTLNSTPPLTERCARRSCGRRAGPRAGGCCPCRNFRS